MIVTRIYGMRVDANNWERVSITVNDDGTEMRIVSEAVGTGSVRQLSDLDWLKNIAAEFVLGDEPRTMNFPGGWTPPWQRPPAPAQPTRC